MATGTPAMIDVESKESIIINGVSTAPPPSALIPVFAWRGYGKPMGRCTYCHGNNITVPWDSVAAREIKVQYLLMPNECLAGQEHREATLPGTQS